MAIDKELFYASHGLKYPVVASQYTDDMQVKEKIYTKDEVVAILTDIQLEIEEKDVDLRYCGHNLMAVDCVDIIQQKIDALNTKVRK